MAKAEIKTRPTDDSVENFLNMIIDERKRADAFSLLEIFKKVTGEEPKMWGPSIIGFGMVPIKYASGRELDWPKVAFSPRKTSVSLYLTCDAGEYVDLLAKFGKHKTGKGCIYFNHLSDIDETVLEMMIKAAYQNA